jgi:hypothetical protein
MVETEGVMAGKMRSPNYPAMSLPHAVEAARKLWTAEKRTAVGNETAAQALGFKSLSGPARVTIGALRQYGLIDKAEKGHIRLSDAAVHILHGDESSKAAGLAQAALEPPLFNELHGTHLDASENAIRSYLLTKKGFAEDGARKAAKAFKETMALATGDASGYTATNEQEKPEAMSGQEVPFSFKSQTPDGSIKSDLMSLIVPYGSQGQQLNVQIRVVGERLKRSHIAKVRRYLELAESDLEDGD